MPGAKRDSGRRGTDLLGVALLGLLALGALGAAYEIVHAGYMTAGALAGVIVVGGAFAAVHSMSGRTDAPKNTHVHGAARPASEQEARRAARGEAQGPRLDDREF